MERALSLQVTTSLMFLRDSKSDLLKLIKLADECIDKINDIDPESSPTGYGKIKEIHEDYKDDFEDVMNSWRDDYELFKEDLSFIKKNKKDNIVKYALSDFKRFCVDYKKLVKLINSMDEDFEYQYEYLFNNKDFAKSIAIKKIYLCTHEINDGVEEIYKKIKDLTKD